MERADVTAWVQRYVRAWKSNDPADIEGLFADDASYYTAPFRDPWVGPHAISRGWIDRKDVTGRWDFRFEVLGVDGDAGFVRGWTTYKDEPNYSNLWVIRLADDGRCTEFIEWWMEEDKPPTA